MNVEFIYDKDCPHIEETRAQLLKAFTQAKLPAKWLEWDRNSEASPNYVRRYGSPTILINGEECVGAKPSDENCCRLYVDGENKLQKAPTVATLLAAFKAANSNNSNTKNSKRFSWKGLLVTLPSIFIAILPKLTCPLCWPAYAGLLSSLGIPFANYTTYLLPFTLLFLLIALFALRFRAKQRHGYLPLYFGVIATLVIIVGKFMLHHNILLYVGVVILVVTSLWNSWPKRNKKSCSNCQ